MEVFQAVGNVLFPAAAWRQSPAVFVTLFDILDMFSFSALLRDSPWLPR